MKGISDYVAAVLARPVCTEDLTARGDGTYGLRTSSARTPRSQKFLVLRVGVEWFASDG